MTESAFLKISVVLPIRNRKIAAFTLKFLEGQLSEDDELLLSFNKSTPEVIETVLAQARKLPARLKVMEWATIRPLYPHWKSIIQAATNDVILFVHDDDVYHGHIVNKVRHTFQDDPEASFVTSQIIVVNLNENLDIRMDGNKTETLVYNWKSYFQEKRLNGYVAQFNTSFYGMRRSKLGNLDFLNKNPVAGDFMLFYSGLIGGNLYVYPEYLAARLQHGNNAVYNELFKPGHATDSLSNIFLRAGIAGSIEGKEFLNHYNKNIVAAYKKAWKFGILAGVDPKKLVVVYRRLRMLDHDTNMCVNYCALKFLIAFRKLKYWKIQNSIFNILLNLYRKIRGPSKFYRQFPKLTIEEFSRSVVQPLPLIKSYLTQAYEELGIKR